MATKTNIPTGDVVTFTVKVNGKVIPDLLNVLSVYVEKKVNRISTARIEVSDGQPNTGQFPASSSATFLPGGEVSIEAGYDSKNALVFKGIITGQSVLVASHGSTLAVECRDPAIRMTVGRKCLSFFKQKDSDIISAIIGTYSGLSPHVAATANIWPEQVQYYVTDWDFILSRAEANGLIITTINGTVNVAKPDADVSPVLTLQYGNNLIDFNADLDATTQLASVKASTWNYKTQCVSTGEVPNNYTGPGNLSSKKLSEVVGLPAYQVQTAGSLDASELTEWSKAYMIKSNYSKITGNATCQGTGLAVPGKYITLQGLGDRFSGDHLLSGVVHNISEGNWITEVSIGMSFQWFIEEPDVMAAPASGQLPGVRGLINGVVKKIYEDPETQYRILVSIPLFDIDGAGVWARLSSFYATSGAGAFFFPEVGDEVVLGFLNEDPRYPVILGSMYSSSKLKPYTGLEPNEKNNLKAIVSRSGISVQFDDENKVLTIASPGKNTIIISDKEKQIAIKDQNQNSITMSDSGITIKSAKNISFEADQNIILKGTQGIKMQSSGGDVATSGINIKQTADMEYSAAGNQMAKITSGMQMTLKSAMIMIN